MTKTTIPDLFVDAERSQKFLRLFLRGPQGSGKTYSALQIAKGLQSKIGGKIGLVDTEKKSSTHYKDIVAFKVLDFRELFDDHNPANYMGLIDMAEQNGYSVLIFDGITPVWAGKGGILEINDQVANVKYKGNSFTAWQDTNKDYYEPFVDKLILNNNIHIICTARTKQEYDISKNDQGKTVVSKLGTKAQQRDDIGYEFDIILDMQHGTDGIALPDKDRTRTFSKIGTKITEQTGIDLYNYLQDKPVSKLEIKKKEEKKFTEEEVIEAVKNAKTQQEVMNAWSLVTDAKMSERLDDLFTTRYKELDEEMVGVET